MLEKKYDPNVSEPKWQQFWLDRLLFKFDPKSKKKIFSIDTPPPTVSGKMHIGHAFSYSQMDFVARYRRMRGFNIFMPFGTDDNGLATNILVEKMNNVKSAKMKRNEFNELALKTLEKVRAERYVKREKGKISSEEAINLILKKDELEKNTFKEMYGFEPFHQEKEADIVIDTSDKTPEQVVEEITSSI